MSGFYDANLESIIRGQGVNLSTSATTNANALLSSVRQERLAREALRVRDRSARRIQAFWRSSVQGQQAREQLWAELERESGPASWLERGRWLSVLLRDRWTTAPPELVWRKIRVLQAWCADGVALPGPQSFVSAVGKVEGWETVLGVVAARILDAIVYEPTDAGSGPLYQALERLFDSKTWSAVDDAAAMGEAKTRLVEAVSSRHWVEQLVAAHAKLVAASRPKTKHPNLVPLTRLLTAPLDLQSAAQTRPILQELLNTLLAVPSLAASLPLSSLTYLSSHLPLFSSLLPLAVENTLLLQSGRLATEPGKTYFLANLATFGITGGMLARNGLDGALNWIKVVGAVVGTATDAWAPWVTGQWEPEEDIDMEEYSDSEDEQEAKQKAEAARQAPARAPLPTPIQNKIVLLASPEHLAYLTETLTLPSAHLPSSTLVSFATYSWALLHAFKRTPQWDGIISGLYDGDRGKRLIKRLWREGVRGRWTVHNGRQGWATFSQNPSTPHLLLLTQLYSHYLLLTADDEFFEPKMNPLLLDEVLELAGTWRDLTYYAYIDGISPGSSLPASGFGTEEARDIMTKGITRVAERNARRKFAQDSFWIMVPKGERSYFIEAAVSEDLSLGSVSGHEASGRASGSPPRVRGSRPRHYFSKRRMAEISPRLGLLNNLPMTVPFKTRLKIFRNFIENDKATLAINDRGMNFNRRTQVKIHRNTLVQDGYDQLSGLGSGLKGELYIKFYDQFGHREAGIDGGGLFKEFLTSLSKEVFDTDRGLWLTTSENQLYPSPSSYAKEAHQLSWYKFIGQVLGKALYEGMLVDVSFADFFLAKWLGRESNLDDLKSLDRDLYRGLIVLKNYHNPEDLALNFTIAEEEFGMTQTIELVPGGSDIAVTTSNKNDYIRLVCKHKLDRQIVYQSRAFFRGLSDLIDSKWLRMFDQRELRQLVGGEETMIDMDDLRKNCETRGFDGSPTIEIFWKVVKEFSQEQRKALMRFVTSCARPPLLGFAYLNPRFAINRNGDDQTRLPTAASCFNLLKLPPYDDEEMLRSKLLQAITSGAGFDMS